MNTQLILDDDTIQQAMRLTGLKTPQEIVEAALHEFIMRKKQDFLAQAFGKYRWKGDLEAMRSDKHVTGG